MRLRLRVGKRDSRNNFVRSLGGRNRGEADGDGRCVARGGMWDTDGAIGVPRIRQDENAVGVHLLRGAERTEGHWVRATAGRVAAVAVVLQVLITRAGDRVEHMDFEGRTRTRLAAGR